MDVASDRVGDLAANRLLPGVVRQQGRVGINFIEIADDGEGLRQRGPVRVAPYRNETRGVSRAMFVARLLARLQVHGDLSRGNPLEVPGNPHPVGGARSPIAEEARLRQGVLHKDRPSVRWRRKWTGRPESSSRCAPYRRSA